MYLVSYTARCGPSDPRRDTWGYTGETRASRRRVKSATLQASTLSKSQGRYYPTPR